MKILIAFFGWVCVLALVSLAFGWRVAISDVRVVDGDSVHLNGSLTRLAGIDAPEFQGRAKCVGEMRKGAAARDFLRAIIKQSTLVIYQKRDRGFFGRDIVDLYVDGKSVAKSLVIHGHAAPSPKGQRLDWCTVLTAG